MKAISTLLRLGLAAGLSGAAAGLLLAVAIFLGSAFDDLLAGGTSAGSGALAAFWAYALFGTTLGILVAAVPAFFAGAAMWATSRGRRGGRDALAWAAAGALVGACFWVLLELSFWTPGRGTRMSYADAGFLLACLLAGAAGALTFRATMRSTAFMDE